MNRTHVFLVVGAVLGAVFSAAGSAGAQVGSARPMVIDGERLVYGVHSSRFGDIGTATMKVDRDTVGDRAAYRLSFDFKAKVMLFNVSDRTRSWLDAGTLSTLRYTKQERSPVGKRDEDARIHPHLNEWHDDAGEFRLASVRPLDELGFIFLVRAIASEIGAADLVIRRHFDESRNPVLLRNHGRVRLAALCDSLYANVIQMDARDGRQKSGTSRITFYIGEDAAGLPLRIDTSMPVAGSLTMTLRSVTPGLRVGERSTAMSPIGAPVSAAGGQN